MQAWADELCPDGATTASIQQPSSRRCPTRCQPASPLAAFRHTFGAGAKTFDGLCSHAAIALPSVPLCCVACEPVTCAFAVPLLCLRCVRRRASFGNSEDGRRQRAVETAFYHLYCIGVPWSCVVSGIRPPTTALLPSPAQHSTFTLLLLLLLFMHTLHVAHAYTARPPSALPPPTLAITIPTRSCCACFQMYGYGGALPTSCQPDSSRC